MYRTEVSGRMVSCPKYFRQSGSIKPVKADLRFPSDVIEGEPMKILAPAMDSQMGVSKVKE